MNKAIKIVSMCLILSSCASQLKTVELSNGKMITQKQYQKKLDKAFRVAKKDAQKSVKGRMSKKETDEFFQTTTVVLDTFK